MLSNPKFARAQPRDIANFGFGTLAFLLLGWVLGSSPAAIAQEADQRATVLHLSQSAERTLLRDLLRVELRVEESGADPRAVQSAINRRMAASQSLILKSKNAETTLKLVGMLQSDGLVMLSLSYEVSAETLRNAQDDLTAEALAAVGRRAASIAEATHLAVLRYRDLRVGNAETEGRPVPRFSGAAMAAGAPPVAEPGEAVVRVTVEAELLLGQPRT
ncbi:MAG: SIMPL domain-containing protein [Alphaproteobacteria bacterium]|nr:MAG: SIMPL domain-containing protein [Alphaproteobacteria bacterium]